MHYPFHRTNVTRVGNPVKPERFCRTELIELSQLKGAPSRRSRKFMCVVEADELGQPVHSSIAATLSDYDIQHKSPLQRRVAPIPKAQYGGRHTVTMLPGAGIGPELMNYVKEVFRFGGNWLMSRRSAVSGRRYVQTPVSWIMWVGVGKKLVGRSQQCESRYGGVPVDFEVVQIDPKSETNDDLDYAITTIRRNGVAIKGNIETGSLTRGVTSRNVALRNELDLYVNVLKCQTYPGVPSRQKNIDIVIIRQNTEGEYAMLEHEMKCFEDYPINKQMPNRQTTGFAAIPQDTENMRVFTEVAAVWARQYGVKRPKWMPAMVTDVLGRNMYGVSFKEGLGQTRHINQLRKCYKRTPQPEDSSERPLSQVKLARYPDKDLVTHQRARSLQQPLPPPAREEHEQQPVENPQPQEQQPAALIDNPARSTDRQYRSTSSSTGGQHRSTTGNTRIRASFEVTETVAYSCSVHGVVESMKVVTQENSERVARFTFEFARKNGRKKYSVFEPGARNTGTSIAGKNIANPIAMLNASVDMLEHLGHRYHAEIIKNAIDKTINEDRIHTPDLGGQATSIDVVQNIIRHLQETTKTTN
uniref:Isopropylmalate dehydrogenase-like domain-containing protein n=1 Tax=Timema bartmani TaxID=61472 RepID=A0A7R9F679_9NEOP|nr:unnamed protein product [Timema bartmani]